MRPTSLQEIASLIGSATESRKITSGVGVDTRLLQPGDLFFALPGAKVDGHLFIEEAASKGAIGAVVSKSYTGPGFGLPLLHVYDPLLALQDLSKRFLKLGHASIVAVTGSLGKTTTKGFIASLLKQKFKVSKSPGNSNSQIGLPLAILNHTSIDDEIIVLEMGMTESGQLSKLIEIAPPDVAVVTMAALVHAANFNSLEDIAKAKAEIFSHSSTKLGIYHKESNINGALTKSGICSKQSFSTMNSDADVALQVNGNVMRIKDGTREHADFPLMTFPGEHNRHNFLAAASVARYFGMSWDEIRSAQPDLELPEMRLQFIEKLGAVFVNDAYNASEMSMKAALNSLPLAKPGGKRIAFLGGMVELGKFSEDCHRSVGKYALNYVDAMFCFGVDCLPIFEEWKLAGRPVVWARNREELAAALKQQLRPGDVVLLKGSRSKDVGKVLDEF